MSDNKRLLIIIVIAVTTTTCSVACILLDYAVRMSGGI